MTITKEYILSDHAHLSFGLRANQGRFPKGPSHPKPRDPATKPPRRRQSKAAR